MTKTKKTALAGILLALAVFLPQFTAHLAGANGGRMFLPMHVPVLLAGLLCGPLYGGIIGIIAPAMSCVITGGAMPAAYPMLPIMCAELLTYGLVSGFCSCKLKNVYIDLIIAMFAGRAAYGVMYYGLMLTQMGEQFKAPSVFAAIAAGVPGIIIQLALIPPIVTAYKRNAKSLVKSGEATLIATKGGSIVYRDSGGGIAPLVKLYESNRDILAGADVFDKAVGKAAAMILILGGARKVYGELMSESAAAYLNSRGVKTDCAHKAEMILNRDGTGICPFENAVRDTDDASEGYENIKRVLSSFKR